VGGARRKARDGWALAGWLLFAVWGWILVRNASYFEHTPGVLRPHDKAVLSSVTGMVMLVLAIALALAAIARLVGGDGPIAPDIVSLVLGWVMIGLFVVFFAWGAQTTKHQGVAAVGIYELPYLIAGVAVLFARSRRLESASVVRT
jgi:hypothetical protein